jgi:hypothetical protein
LQRATVSFVMSVSPSISLFVRPSAWNNSAAIGRTLMKLDIWAFLTVSRENSGFIKIRQE